MNKKPTPRPYKDAAELQRRMARVCEAVFAWERLLTDDLATRLMHEENGPEMLNLICSLAALYEEVTIEIGAAALDS